MYHPDFTDGKPSFFDISVVSTLQPSNINLASAHAGAMAAMREREKDDKHFATVEEAGGGVLSLLW